MRSALFWLGLGAPPHWVAPRLHMRSGVAVWTPHTEVGKWRPRRFRWQYAVSAVAWSLMGVAWLIALFDAAIRYVLTSDWRVFGSMIPRVNWWQLATALVLTALAIVLQRVVSQRLTGAIAATGLVVSVVCAALGWASLVEMLRR